MRTKDSPAAVFEKVLRAFETGGFTYADVLWQLKRLLAAGASPTELLEILRHYELYEPLPEDVHAKVLDLLNDAIGRTAEPADTSTEAQNAGSDTSPSKSPDSVPAPPRPMSASPAMQPAEGPAKATPVALTSVFERVLNAIETRDFTDADVLAELQRLLVVTGASPAVLLEILRRRKLIESLPENAYAEVLGLLNGAMERAGVLVSDEVQDAEPDTAAGQIPETAPAPPRPAPMAPPVERTKRAAMATTVTVTSLRSPELTSKATPNGIMPPHSVPPTTPIQIAAPKETARPASPRIPTTSPVKGPSPAPTVIPGPIPIVGPSRSPAEGARAAVTPSRTMPPNSFSAKAGVTAPVQMQATSSSGSTSPHSRSVEQTAAMTPARTRPPDSVPAKTGDIPSVLAQAATSIPAEASTAGPPPKPTPTPATTPPSQPPAVETAVVDEEVTIDLDELEHVIEVPTPIAEAASRVSVEVGDVLLDRYRLAALIGEGGMSRVFKATDLGKTTPASPDSFIAVKVLTRAIDEDSGSFAAFRKEVQKLRGLAHPNIVRIFDCDRDGSTVFITMEYLDGASLFAKLHGGAAAGIPPFRLERDQAQNIILAIADALDYAHRSGVVHGDLKPGNVIVLNRSEIKVIDFDVARWVARPDTGLERGEASHQKSSSVTPLYASPQLMARQKPEPADDVYALACLAYELLTGTHPLDAGAGAQSLQFPPPHRAGLSPPQYSAVVRGLQRDRGNRTPTVRQFVAEFSAPERPAARKPGPIGRAMGVGAAVLVLAVVAWFFVHRAPVPAPVPAAPTAAVPNPGAVIRDCPTCPEMTVLPSGRFKQGAAPAESGSASFAKPQHWVVIGRPLAMSTNAVTVDEFQQFIAATGRDMRGCDTYDGEWKHRPKNNWKNPGFTQAGTHPVTCTSWNDAEAYARWLSTATGHRYRLPSASEWEYAARAGGEAVLPWGSDGSGACANANVADASAAHRYPGWAVFGCDDGYVYTSPVGSFKANSLGLNDMLGNVLQWTEDCWHADYTGAPIDGSARTDGNCSERELRGGSWFTTPAYVRADYRNHFAADYRTSSVGIRLVRDIQP